MTTTTQNEMNIENLWSIKQSLEIECNTSSDALKGFSRLDNGLTPDAIRQTNDWKIAKARYDRAFKKLRDFNGKYIKLLRNN